MKKQEKLIGISHIKYSDEQIEEIINSMHALSDLAIDTWLAKTQEERKAFAEEVK